MLSVTLLVGALALGGWGAGGCGPVGPAVTSGYEWRHTDGSPWHQLFHDGAPAGIWNEQTARFQRFDPATGAWGAEERPPWKPAAKSCGCGPACSCGDACHCAEGKPCNPDCACGKPAEVKNFGIIREKLAEHGEHYLLNGKSVSSDDARQALASGGLPDDAGKPRLTIIGPEADRRRVLDDLAKAPALAEFRDHFLVQAYPPEHWAVANSGFVTDGRPTIYMQAPDGKVLHRQNDYAGPEDLAQAIRRADPNYDSRKDPDLRQPSPLARFSLARIPTAVWLLAGGCLFLFLLRKDLR